MVVLPDYQGIGIGTAFEDYTSKHYADEGWKMNITTTTPALVHALKKSDKWNLVRFGRNKYSMADFDKYGKGNKKENKRKSKSLVKSESNNRVTYSFNYKN